MSEPTVSLRDGERLADYAIRVTRELANPRNSASGPAQVAGQRDGEFQEIVTLRHQLANALDSLKYECDQRRQAEQELAAIASAFAPYLKEGETPIERLARERHDSDILMTLLAEAREKLAEREATVDILAQRVHERDAELGELKQSGKTERRFTNDYIKALHKAERQRDELRALLSDADERAHLAHGVAELAMKHRDAAERECDDLRALLTAVAQSGVSWTTRDYVVAQIDRATWDAVQKIGGRQ